MSHGQFNGRGVDPDGRICEGSTPETVDSRQVIGSKDRLHSGVIVTDYGEANRKAREAALSRKANSGCLSIIAITSAAGLLLCKFFEGISSNETIAQISEHILAQIKNIG